MLSYSRTPLRKFNNLFGKIVCFLDCEYVTKGMPGKTRPNTLKDHIELVQIGCICVDLNTGKEVSDPLNLFVKDFGSPNSQAYNMIS